MIRRRFLKTGISGSLLAFILKPSQSNSEQKQDPGQKPVNDAEHWKKLADQYGPEFGKPVPE